MKRLRDHEKATLFLYILQKGLPPWEGGPAVVQVRALAALTGWDEARAGAAFERAKAAGFAYFEDPCGGV